MIIVNVSPSLFDFVAGRACNFHQILKTVHKKVSTAESDGYEDQSESDGYKHLLFYLKCTLYVYSRQMLRTINVLSPFCTRRKRRGEEDNEGEEEEGLYNRRRRKNLSKLGWDGHGKG